MDPKIALALASGVFLFGAGYFLRSVAKVKRSGSPPAVQFDVTENNIILNKDDSVTVMNENKYDSVKVLDKLPIPQETK